MRSVALAAVASLGVHAALAALVARRPTGGFVSQPALEAKARPLFRVGVRGATTRGDGQRADERRGATAHAETKTSDGAEMAQLEPKTGDGAASGRGAEARGATAPMDSKTGEVAEARGVTAPMGMAVGDGVAQVTPGAETRGATPQVEARTGDGAAATTQMETSQARERATPGAETRGATPQVDARTGDGAAATTQMETSQASERATLGADTRAVTHDGTSAGAVLSRGEEPRSAHAATNERRPQAEAGSALSDGSAGDGARGLDARAGARGATASSGSGAPGAGRGAAAGIGDDGDVTPLLHARLAQAAEPCYPAAARRFRQHGTAHVTFCVDGHGGVERVEGRGSGFDLLDEAARTCVVARAAPFPERARGRCYSVPVQFGR